jgi:hypothetical protein
VKPLKPESTVAFEDTEQKKLEYWKRCYFTFGVEYIKQNYGNQIEK